MTNTTCADRRLAWQRSAFLGVSAGLFIATAAVTIVSCRSMAAMGAMPMPGNWTMSMVWMRMPGQTWPGAAASFLAMWVVMMVAMMLPSLAPVLWRYRQVVDTASPARVDALAAIVAVGYALVWTAIGIGLYLAGVSLAAIAMQQPAVARAVPLTAGVAILVAAAVQFTAWKARHLACCRHMPGGGPGRSGRASTALRLGVRLGLHCASCCGNLMAILIIVGVMDVPAMVLVTAAITAERYAPDGGRVASAIGIIAAGTGALVIARAVGLG
jgi:predicted metal-binding membrane protein